MQPTWHSDPETAQRITRSTLEWLHAKVQTKAMSARANRLRDELDQFVAVAGYADDKGHIYLDLPTPLEVGGTKVGALKREKRISRTANIERIGELADRVDAEHPDAHLRERLFPLRPVLDEDELYVAYQDGLVSEADIDDVFDAKVTWAFTVAAL